MLSKKFLLLFLIVLGLTGCATTVRYFSYTDRQFVVKPKNYFVTIYPVGKNFPSSQSYVVIGKVDISGNMDNGVTPQTLTEQAQAIARKKGADAMINVKTENFTYDGVYEIPGHISYRPVIFEGRHEREVVYMEHYHPTRYIPYRETILTFEGDLIVMTPGFQPEDKGK